MPEQHVDVEAAMLRPLHKEEYDLVKAEQVGGLH